MAMTPGASVSIFDVDRTLTRLPTWSPFLLFAAWRHRPWRLLLLPALIPVALLYAASLLGRRRMKMAMHRLLLGGRMPAATATRLGEEFARRIYATGLYDAARQRIRREQAEGRRIVLATAAPDLYARPLAALLGIDDVVATRCTWRGGMLLASIQGENCYGMAKRDMIVDHLARHGIARDVAHIRFFSDHASDLPMFEWVDEPIAVNASPALATIARARGWPCLDWRAAEPRNGAWQALVSRAALAIVAAAAIGLTDYFA